MATWTPLGLTPRGATRQVRFFMEFMKAGFDVLCSDLDVMWLSDPRPWVRGTAADSTLLGLADVVVSTDVTHGTLDKDEAGWGINNEMNTGMVLLRSSEGAMVFCRRWQARMQQEMLKVAKLSSAMVQWWTNDQTFFNEVVHQASTLHAAQIKDPVEGKREAAAQELRAASPSKARLAHLDRTMRHIESLFSSSSKYSKPAELTSMRGLLFKRVGCTQHEGKDVCLEEGKKEQVFTITTFPYQHFASGHTYFTQSLQERRGFVPVSVHTTFQFGDTPEFTWGKRNRLREKRLWLVDDETYYQRKGPGPDPNEIKYSGYLQLTIPPLVPRGMPSSPYLPWCHVAGTLATYSSPACWSSTARAHLCGRSHRRVSRSRATGHTLMGCTRTRATCTSSRKATPTATCYSMPSRGGWSSTPSRSGARSSARSSCRA